MGKGLILAGLLVLAACQTPSGGTFCDVTSPIRPTRAEIEALSPETAAQILALNEKGARLCGWQP